MMIDLRTRIWSNLEQFGPETSERLRDRFAERWDRLDGSAAAHERATGCVSASFVFGFRSDHLQAAVPNELIAEFVQKDPARRVGIAGIDPMADNALEAIDHAIYLGLSGIAINPGMQNFHPTHSSAMMVYEKAADHELPVFVASDVPVGPSTSLQFSRPANFDEVARNVPELKLIIGDFGFPYTHETIAMIDKHPNVFADVATIVGRSWDLYNALLTAASCGVMNKILFGSGFPFESPARAIESLYSVNAYSQGTQLASIPRSLIREIVERDTIELLGIDASIGQADIAPNQSPNQTTSNDGQSLMIDSTTAQPATVVSADNQPAENHHNEDDTNDN